MTVTMEIKTDNKHCRLEQFPSFEEFSEQRLKSLRYSYNWERLTEVERLDRYLNARKWFIRQQCQMIKAFMNGNGHRRRRGNA